MFTVGKRSDAPLRVTIAEAQGDDPAAVVVLTPITMPMRRRAMAAARRYLAAIGVEPTEVTGDLLFDVSDEMSRELIRLGVVAIEGIADEATGEPFEITPDRNTRLRTASDEDRPTGTIDDLLADERIFDKLDADYVMPDAKRRAEKNGLSGSPNGTSSEATPGNATAKSAARPKRRAAATSARTPSTRCKARKAKGSGRR